MDAEITLEGQPQNVESGWLLWHLTKLEVSVTVSPANYESRKVTATFVDAAPVRVAIPIFPGNGTQPENTIVLMNVQDQAQLMIQQLENAINETIQKKGSW
jgi:hypothetical protein